MATTNSTTNLVRPKRGIKRTWGKLWKVIKYLAFLVLVTAILDVVVMRVILNYGHYRQLDHHHRYPAPYVMFTGKPNVRSHNELGYPGASPTRASEGDLKIAFFGGSTGYLGKPPIAELLQQELGKQLGKVFIANYSAVSANHRQHLHGMVEYLPQFKPDIVIFYGGYNEHMPPFRWDPRPGYPYNYYYREETAPFTQLLMKNSALFGLLDRKYGRVSSLAQLRESNRAFSEEWLNSLADKYFETIEIANNVARAFRSTRCKTTKFVAFYQPFKIRETFAKTHESIRERTQTLEYVFDVSAEFEPSDFTDHVHVKQEARAQMANTIATILLDQVRGGLLSDCSSQ